MTYMPPSRSPLSPDRIQIVLTRMLTQATQVDALDLDPEMLTDYQRIMNIYAIVQMGGREIQREAMCLNYQRQVHTLQAEADPAQPQLLQQELADLERSIAWQLKQLEQILPSEEVAVSQSLAAIETFIQKLNQSSA